MSLSEELREGKAHSMPTMRRSHVLLLLALVALVAIAGWGVVRFLSPGDQERAATQTLESVSMPPSFEFRYRYTQGSGGFDFHDTYLGPAREVEAGMARVPPNFRPFALPIPSRGGYRFMGAWVVNVGGLECDVSLEQLLDPIDQSVFAKLNRQQAAAVRAQRLAVVQVSALCDRPEH